MKILAVETASMSCSAALYCDGKTFIRATDNPRQQSQILLTFIDELLQEAGIAKSDLTGLAWSAGPGSFTGLRIGAGIVAGLAYGLELPVVPVSTLAAMAQRAYDEHKITNSVVALDARMEEVYWGAYQIDMASGLVKTVTAADQVAPPDRVVVPASVTVASTVNNCEWHGIGSGFAVYTDAIKNACGCESSWPECEPHAEQVLKLALPKFAAGAVLNAAQVIPVYCRDNVAHKKSS